MSGEVKAPLAPVVVALALLSSACGAERESSDSPLPGGPVVAKVGDANVTVDQVEALLEETRKSFRIRGRPFPAAGTPYYLDLRDQAVRYLVERAAHEQEAARLGVRVEPAEIDREVSAVDQKDLREAMKRDGLTLDRVRADIRDRLLDRGVFKALVGRASEEDNLGEEKSHWKRRLESALDDVRWASGWKPAERLRSPVPPELQNLPKPDGRCDVKKGTFTFREAWARGCIQEWGIPVPGIDGTPCREVPIDDFVVGGFSGPETEIGYHVWSVDDNAGSCVGYPSKSFSVTTGRGPCFGGPRGRGPNSGTCLQTWVSDG